MNTTAGLLLMVVVLCCLIISLCLSATMILPKDLVLSTTITTIALPPNARTPRTTRPTMTSLIPKRTQAPTTEPRRTTGSPGSKPVSWFPLGPGVQGNQVETMALDNKTGNLYVAGAFQGAGGLPANNIALWALFDRNNPMNGQWKPLGSGIQGGASIVNALILDQQNGHLYVGGDFEKAGESVSNHFAIWVPNNREQPFLGNWRSLPGGGVSDRVESMALDLETGNIVLAGAFASAGGVATKSIAWFIPTTSRYHPFPPLPLGIVVEECLAIALDQKTGSVFGSFRTTSNVFFQAVWQPMTRRALVGEWHLLPAIYVSKTGFPATTIEMDSSTGNVYCASSLSNAAFVWQPSDRQDATKNGRWVRWVEAREGQSLTIACIRLVVAADSKEKTLIIGGTFARIGDESVNNIASWEIMSETEPSMGQWSKLGHGMPSTIVNVSAVVEDPISGALFAGGNFALAGEGPASNIAVWSRV